MEAGWSQQVSVGPPSSAGTTRTCETMVLHHHSVGVGLRPCGSVLALGLPLDETCHSNCSLSCCTDCFSSAQVGTEAVTTPSSGKTMRTQLIKPLASVLSLPLNSWGPEEKASSFHSVLSPIPFGLAWPTFI